MMYISQCFILQDHCNQNSSVAKPITTTHTDQHNAISMSNDVSNSALEEITTISVTLECNNEGKGTPQ